MNEPVTNKSVIFLIVFTLCVNGTIGVGALAYCLTFNKEPNATILTAFVAIVNFVLGAISGMLVKTSPTETTKSVTVSDQPTVTDSTKDPKP